MTYCMYAYRVGNIKYNLRGTKGEVCGGDGSLWISSDSILIKEKSKWLYIQGNHIKGAKIKKEALLLRLVNDSSVELNSKNVYILNALYHYIEGAIWKKA